MTRVALTLCKPLSEKYTCKKQIYWPLSDLNLTSEFTMGLGHVTWPLRACFISYFLESQSSQCCHSPGSIRQRRTWVGAGVGMGRQMVGDCITLVYALEVLSPVEAGKVVQPQRPCNLKDLKDLDLGTVKDKSLVGCNSTNL